MTTTAFEKTKPGQKPKTAAHPIGSRGTSDPNPIASGCAAWTASMGPLGSTGPAERQNSLCGERCVDPGICGPIDHKLNMNQQQATIKLGMRSSSQFMDHSSQQAS